MYHSDDDQSDGVPTAPAPPAIRSVPTDVTVRGFALLPAAPPDAVTAAVSVGQLADGSQDTAAVSAAAIARVAAIADDAATAVVTPLDPGYRFAVLKQVAALAIAGGEGWTPLRFVNGRLPVEVHVDTYDHRRIVVTVRRWRDFSAWVRAQALNDFIALKGTLATWPDIVKHGARSVLRQLTEACHQKPTPDGEGNVNLYL